MSGPIAVGTSPTNIISPGPSTRLIIVANQGAATVFLKLDSSATVLTITNGHPLGAGQTIQIGCNAGRDGTELPSIIQGIVAAGTVSVTAQTAPF